MFETDLTFPLTNTNTVRSFFSLTNVDLMQQNRLTYLHKPAKTSTATRPNQASEARPKTDVTTNIPINTTITDTTITDHC